MQELIDEAKDFLEYKTNDFIESLVDQYENEESLSECQEECLREYVEEQRNKMPTLNSGRRSTYE